MKAHQIPVGQRIIDTIHKHRYLITIFLIVLNAGAICLARSTSGGHGKGPMDIAESARPEDGNKLLLEIMNGQMNAVPEPGSAGLLLGGLVMLLFKRPLPKR